MTYVLCAIAAAIGMAGAWSLRKQSFFWAGGLLIGGLAAICYAIAAGGSPLAFTLYYALGASMLPGWIGAGSLRVAFGQKLARWPGLLIILLSVVQLGLTLPAGIDPQAFSTFVGTNGAGVLRMGAWVAPTVLFNTLGLGFAAVAAFFAWWRAFRIQAASNAALAIGLSVVVLGILCRSDAVYKMMLRAGATEFMLADVVAFALIWAGALLTRQLPAPLRRALMAPTSP